MYANLIQLAAWSIFEDEKDAAVIVEVAIHAKDVGVPSKGQGQRIETKRKSNAKVREGES